MYIMGCLNDGGPQQNQILTIIPKKGKKNPLQEGISLASFNASI